MKIVNSIQMKKIDEIATTYYNIPSILLMENAGREVANEIISNFSNEKIIGIFVGAGNNGGDGLSCARYLFFNNFKIIIFLVGKKEKFSELTKLNFEIIKKFNIEILDISDLNKFEAKKNEILKCDLIVDAILGIGSIPPLKTPLKEIVEFLNSLNKPVISIDIPTGLSSDTPEVVYPVIKATKTITFGLPKISLILSPSKKYAGDLKLVNIGFPDELLKNSEINLNLIEISDIKEFIPDRPKDAHKGFFGHTIIFAGSEGKAGAAAMASISALKAGCGLVTTICPKEINDCLQSYIKEIMTKPIDLNNDIEKEFSKIIPLLEKSDVIAAGCGITTENKVKKFLEKLLSLENKIFVLDADAINIISENKNLLKNDKSKFILTPHIGELSKLLNKKLNESLNDRIDLPLKFAKDYNCIIVEKSAETIILSPTEEIFICNKGCEGMATAGSGDVLTGIIAGVLAQNVKQNKNILGSVNFAVLLHSIAGSIACKKFTSYSMLAGDIIENINESYKFILKQI